MYVSVQSLEGRPFRSQGAVASGHRLGAYINRLYTQATFSHNMRGTNANML